MARVSVLLCVMLACVLSSCYTNVNQLWFKGKREYEVSWFDYCADKKGEVSSLPPRLYRCGDEWYIAARYSKFRDQYPGSCVQWVGMDYEERHGIAPNLQAPICYHRITPGMAARLQHRNVNSLNCFEEKMLREDMAQAGGEWVPRLPAGARAVRAEGLSSSNSSLLLVSETNHASWLAYPASWLTFLCVDVPATTLSFVLTPVYFAINAPQGEDGVYYNDYVEGSVSWWAEESDSAPPPPPGRHGSHRLPPGPPAHSSALGKPHAPSPGHAPSGGRDKQPHGGNSHHHSSHGGGSHGGGHHHHSSSADSSSRHHGHHSRSEGDRKRDDSSSKDHSSSSKKHR